MCVLTGNQRSTTREEEEAPFERRTKGESPAARGCRDRASLRRMVVVAAAARTRRSDATAAVFRSGDKTQSRRNEPLRNMAMLAEETKPHAIASVAATAEALAKNEQMLGGIGFLITVISVDDEEVLPASTKELKMEDDGLSASSLISCLPYELQSGSVVVYSPGMQSKDQVDDVNQSVEVPEIGFVNPPCVASDRETDVEICIMMGQAGKQEGLRIVGSQEGDVFINQAVDDGPQTRITIPRLNAGTTNLFLTMHHEDRLLTSKPATLCVLPENVAADANRMFQNLIKMAPAAEGAQGEDQAILERQKVWSNFATFLHEFEALLCALARTSTSPEMRMTGTKWELVLQSLIRYMIVFDGWELICFLIKKCLDASVEVDLGGFVPTRKYLSSGKMLKTMVWKRVFGRDPPAATELIHGTNASRVSRAEMVPSSGEGTPVESSNDASLKMLSEDSWKSCLSESTREEVSLGGDNGNGVVMLQQSVMQQEDVTLGSGTQNGKPVDAGSAQRPNSARPSLVRRLSGRLSEIGARPVTPEECATTDDLIVVERNAHSEVGLDYYPDVSNQELEKRPSIIRQISRAFSGAKPPTGQLQRGVGSTTEIYGNAVTAVRRRSADFDLSSTSSSGVSPNTERSAVPASNFELPAPENSGHMLRTLSNTIRHMMDVRRLYHWDSARSDAWNQQELQHQQSLTGRPPRPPFKFDSIKISSDPLEQPLMYEQATPEEADEDLNHSPFSDHQAEPNDDPLDIIEEDELPESTLDGSRSIPKSDSAISGGTRASLNLDELDVVEKRRPCVKEDSAMNEIMERLGKLEESLPVDMGHAVENVE